MVWRFRGFGYFIFKYRIGAGGMTRKYLGWIYIYMIYLESGSMVYMVV